MLEVWSWPTPNGHKVHIALEELGLQYKVIPVNIGAGDQFKPEFLKITPNHRIPAIVDPDGPGGKPFTLFEIGRDPDLSVGKERRQADPERPDRTLQMPRMDDVPDGWRRPDVRPVEPFRRLCAGKIPYAIERYTNEVKRLTRVLNHRLEESPWLAGGEYSMADIITFPWIRTAIEPSSRFAERGYIDLGEYPAVRRWHDEIASRPAVRRGLAVLADAQRPGAITNTERENTFGATQFAVR